MGISPEAVVARVQVNIPFPFLLNGQLQRFLDLGLNPEIGLDGWSLGTYSPETFRRVARALALAGRRCTVHGPFQDLSPGARDDLILGASRQRLRQAWRWLPVFCPEAAICHLGYEDRHFRWDQDNWLARVTATYRELGARAGDCGVRLMLENVYERDPELMLAAVRRIDLPNVLVCLDVGHVNAFGDGDFERWLEVLWPVIGHLHLHDNQGSRDDHQALGTGTVPLEFVLTYLAERGRQPRITLEPHQESSLAPSLEFLARVWPWD